MGEKSQVMAEVLISIQNIQKDIHYSLRTIKEAAIRQR